MRKYFKYKDLRCMMCKKCRGEFKNSEMIMEKDGFFYHVDCWKKTLAEHNK